MLYTAYGSLVAVLDRGQPRRYARGTLSTFAGSGSGGDGMACPRCQYENRPQAKFCEECATPLSRVCSNCSAPLSATAKFCPECAHSVAAGGVQPRFVSPDSYTPKHLAEK